MRSWIYIAVAACILCSGLTRIAHAQSDDVSLGDLARELRKNQPPPRDVIDNDNLPAVMEDGENKKWAATMPPLLPPKATAQLINMSAPNVTCALSFSATSADLLANAPRPQRLPDDELARLDGPATIVGNTLEISVLNATAWDVREITVGLTILRKPLAPSLGFLVANAKLLPATAETTTKAHKEADTTVLYHIHGAAAPYSRAVFREELGRALEPDEEWHWSILQAKGMPPAEPVRDQGVATADAGVTNPPPAAPATTGVNPIAGGAPAVITGESDKPRPVPSPSIQTK